MRGVAGGGGAGTVGGERSGKFWSNGGTRIMRCFKLIGKLTGSLTAAGSPHSFINHGIVHVINIKVSNQIMLAYDTRRQITHSILECHHPSKKVVQHNKLIAF